MFQAQEMSFGQSINILVYGWYNHNNIGDELFKEAFKMLLPNVKFTFVDCLSKRYLKEASALFIGGGSFLWDKLVLEDDCFNLIKTKDIFYIGVGSETDIHPMHLELFKIAKLISLRSDNKLEEIKKINPNTILTPDIVWLLAKNINKNIKEKSVLVIPNILTVPQNIDAHWKFNSWNNFKFEFSQCLDKLAEDGFKINFLPMCRNNKEDDFYAATEIISCMNNRNYGSIINATTASIIDVIGQYEVVISQRLHGVVLSEITNTKCMSIWHHDKLKIYKVMNGESISFYGFYKRNFLDLFNKIVDNKTKTMSIESNMFKGLESSLRDFFK